MLTVGTHDLALDFTESRLIFMVYNLAIEPYGAKTHAERSTLHVLN